MNPGTTENPFNFKINHDVAVTGYLTRIWRATKKYSVNNTIPIVAVNTWLQFSLAYVAAVIVTSHDMSFITNILNSKAMSAYALASVILGTILLASLVIKHAHKQEIKDEILKNGKNTIDREIRGGESDGINEIAQNALTIEIIPDMSFIGNKKENFSIVLPISGKQGKILENKRQENRNKIVLLTVPYVLSGLTVVGALIKFGFVNIQSWKQWTFIAAVGVIAIVGACITLSKLRNNEVDNACNTVKRFDNEDILLPFRKGSVVSVIENKFESKEKDDLQSQALKLFERFLTGFKNDVCSILNEQLTEANKLLEKKLLNPSSKKIQETLDHLKKIREDIKKDLDELHKEISKILNNGKGLTEDVNSPSLADLIKAIYSKAEAFNVRSYIGYFTKNKESSDGSQRDNEFFAMIKKYKDEAEKLQNEVKELKKQMEELKNKQTQPSEPETSSLTSNGPQRDEEEELDEELARLEKEERMEEKREKIKKLKKARPKQKEIKEWKKEINGKPSEFLYYVLESIKLGEKATLRNLDNKIIIHWKDGSQTTCHIEKQGYLPSTKVDFVDKNIQAAFEAACVG
ncbi:hypothetical protein [Wolbachia pipientis]|uniref:hypothetical protein n=1 Tax=Wolbachia pipientis TaxID=955 RepID=UPI00202DC3BC|nr:hypothetical protein [Wolbachia pipientis]MCM1001815.1 hypothetical protein [Wolbachia pipientis]